MDTHQQSIKTARLAGFWYLCLAISGVMGFMVFHPLVFAPGDAQQTLNNLMNQASTARFRLVFELLIVLSQALSAVWFYKLFRPINPWAASTLGIWGTVNAVVIMVSAIAMHSAIDLANSTLPVENKVMLVQLLTRIISNAWLIGGLFFGLWLLPMGYIVISSGRMPVWLGRILILGGAGYILQTLLSSAGIKHTVVEFLPIPATIGEFWMIGYLLWYGIRPETSKDETKNPL